MDLPVDQLDVSEEYAGGVVVIEGSFANAPEEEKEEVVADPGRVGRKEN